MTNEHDRGGARCPIFPKQGPRAVILCDGPAPEESLLQYWLGGADLFICADAAGHPYDHLPRLPEVVIGDFDSLAGCILDSSHGTRFLQVEDQYTTDSEKALIYAAEQGMTEAVLIGGVGGRLDHTLYNCQLVERFADQMEICLVDPVADWVRLGPGAKVSWDLPTGTLFSLSPALGKVSGVTIDGAEFPLLGEELGPGGPATLSNRVLMSPLLISVGEGSLLVAVEREPEF